MGKAIAIATSRFYKNHFSLNNAVFVVKLDSVDYEVKFKNSIFRNNQTIQDNFVERPGGYTGRS